MKKLVVIVLTFVIAIGGVAPAANAADNRSFQYSKSDKKTPPGMPSYFNLASAQVGITEDDAFQFFLMPKSRVNAQAIVAPAEYKIELDVDLDGSTDFTLSSNGVINGNTTESRQLLDVYGTPVSGCEALSWITPNSDAFAWELPKDCINPSGYLNLIFSSTADGTSFDQYPDGNTWWKVRTNWLKAEPCQSYLSNTKRTYGGVTYICNRTGGSWKWRDYGVIAAAKSKYLTEKAFYICHLGSKYGATLEDRGKTLSLSSVYKYFLTESDFACVKRVVGMPAYIQRKIDNTRALDGTVEGKWGKLNAFWTYHPDAGLNITISYN